MLERFQNMMFLMKQVVLVEYVGFSISGFPPGTSSQSV
jgi:hypothetical protein